MRAHCEYNNLANDTGNAVGRPVAQQNRSTQGRPAQNALANETGILRRLSLQ
jgi:hypothetical protein